MRLGDIVEQLDELDPEATIYAERPWLASSRALVALEPEDGSLPDGAEGMAYFLEVDAALIASAVSAAATRFDRVLHYAEYDAYLFEP